MEVKTFKLNTELHTAIKVKASQEGKTMSEWLSEAIKEHLGPSKREIILDAMTARPLLKFVYNEIPIDGIHPEEVIKKVIQKYQENNPGITESRIDNALEELSTLGAIKKVPMRNPPTLGYRYNIRRLDL
jgi:16S rRNA C967 or C1407 C5-methylase (RsmB/RsmF family)